MPLNLKLVLYNRAFELLEAHTPFIDVFKPGNYKPNKATARGSVLANRSAGQPADWPRLVIDVTEEIDGDRPPVTFCRDANAADYGVPVTLNMDVRIIHDPESTLEKQSIAENTVRYGLMTGGQNFGIAWVSGHVLRGTKRSVETDPVSGTKNCPTDRFKIVVTGRPKWKSLIAV